MMCAACDSPTGLRTEEPAGARAQVLVFRTRDQAPQAFAYDLPAPEIVIKPAVDAEIAIAYFSSSLAELDLLSGPLGEGRCALPFEVMRSRGDFLEWFASNAQGDLEAVATDALPSWARAVSIPGLDLACRCDVPAITTLQPETEGYRFTATAALGEDRYLFLSTPEERYSGTAVPTRLWLAFAEPSGEAVLELVGELDDRYRTASHIDGNIVLAGEAWVSGDGLVSVIDASQLLNARRVEVVSTETIFERALTDRYELAAVLQPDGQGRLRVVTDGGVVFVRQAPAVWVVQQAALDVIGSSSQPYAAPIETSRIETFDRPGGATSFALALNINADVESPQGRFLRVTPTGLELMPVAAQLFEAGAMEVSGAHESLTEVPAFTVELGPGIHTLIEYNDTRKLLVQTRTFDSIGGIYSIQRFERGPHPMLLLGSFDGRMGLVYEDGTLCADFSIGGKQHVRKIVAVKDQFLAPRAEVRAFKFPDWGN